VHLALEERLPDLSRELLVCHFPLRDGANSQVLLTAALDMATSLIRTRTPTLICCSAGMSRTPAIAAGALALATGEDPTECLRALTTDAACDVSPMLWESVLNNVQERRGS
jgi:protein-tyrosine phosphatase